ncbi:MAG: hypothetical protein WC043_11140 [Pseudobdellovibrionaceae bacterium]
MKNTASHTSSALNLPVLFVSAANGAAGAMCAFQEGPIAKTMAVVNFTLAAYGTFKALTANQNTPAPRR